MSLVNDVLRDLDERNRHVAGDRSAARLESSDGETNVRVLPAARLRSVGYRYVTVSAVLAGIALGGSALFRLEPVPTPPRSGASVIPEPQLEAASGVLTPGAHPEGTTRSEDTSMAESSEPMPQEDANALGVSSPSARASIIEVPAVRPALSKDGTTRTVTAQPPRRARSDTAMLPRYIRPLTRKDAPPRASSDGGESSESSALAEPRATSSASTGPRSRTTAKLAVAAHRQPSADAAETDRPAYIEVTPRTLSAEEQLLSDFHTAADAYKEGAFAEAERLLKELIGRDQGQHRARLLLARLYTDRDLDELAEAVLSQGLLHYPRHAPYAGFYAQILARQGRDDAAIALLRKALPAAHENAELHALLAGLYRRTGDPSAAARSYLTALRIDPTPGEWWTGLGISSEQAGDGDMAQDAYRKALQSPLTGEVEQYVKQRLRELLAKRTNDNGHRDKADLKS